MKDPTSDITKEQRQLLMFTTLQDGRNAWDVVSSWPDDEERPWVAAAILSCVDHCYTLDRLTISWEARELRFADAGSTSRGTERHPTPAAEHHEYSFLNDCRDIVAYVKGQPSQPTVAGSLRLAIREESDRLIAVAKTIDQFIPSTDWNTFGVRTKKLSGESIVFFDEPNSRVVKFKDPFAYIALKGDNPYSVLYEHHVHNHFFGDVGYRFLGVSQDPVSGGVRLVFEQPFVDTLTRPTGGDIHEWFASRGFYLTADGFWYSDGNVSFTDVWADNCLKDRDGNLLFIDPIVKLHWSPKDLF